MGTEDRQRDEKLPITAELGDEGGSYGDATAQAETFEETPGNPRVDRTRAAATGGHAQAVASQGEPAGESAAEVKPPTGPPDND